MFLTIQDISASLHNEVRDMLARWSEAIILEHCATAESVVESYLSRRYNIRSELEKEGSNRNKLLISVTRDLAIYYLYGNAEQIPKIRVDNYYNAIKILDDIKVGDVILPAVPSAPAPGDGTPDADAIAWGSRPPRAPLFQ